MARGLRLLLSSLGSRCGLPLHTCGAVAPAAAGGPSAARPLGLFMLVPHGTPAGGRWVFSVARLQSLQVLFVYLFCFLNWLTNNAIFKMFFS